CRRTRRRRRPFSRPRKRRTLQRPPPRGKDPRWHDAMSAATSAWRPGRRAPSRSRVASCSSEVRASRSTRSRRSCPHARCTPSSPRTSIRPSRCAPTTRPGSRPTRRRPVSPTASPSSGDRPLPLRTDDAPGLAAGRARIRIADGFPLVVRGHRLGAHRLERLTGADLLPLAAQVAAERGWRIALTGGGPGVAAHAAAVLRDSTDADVVAVDFPRVSDVDDPASLEVVEALASLEPDLVFVCLGSPKQDVWVSRWRAKLPPAVYIGAGAAVDF